MDVTRLDIAAAVEAALLDLGPSATPDDVERRAECRLRADPVPDRTITVDFCLRIPLAACASSLPGSFCARTYDAIRLPASHLHAAARSALNGAPSAFRCGRLEVETSPMDEYLPHGLLIDYVSMGRMLDTVAAQCRLDRLSGLAGRGPAFVQALQHLSGTPTGEPFERRPAGTSRIEPVEVLVRADRLTVKEDLVEAVDVVLGCPPGRRILVAQPNPPVEPALDVHVDGASIFNAFRRAVPSRLNGTSLVERSGVYWITAANDVLRRAAAEVGARSGVDVRVGHLRLTAGAAERSGRALLDVAALAARRPGARLDARRWQRPLVLSSRMPVRERAQRVLDRLASRDPDALLYFVVDS